MFWPTVARNSTHFFRSCLPCVAAWASCFRTYSRLPSTTISSIRAFVRPIWTTFPNSIIALSTIRPFCTTGSTDFRVGSACLMVFRNLAVITMTSAFVYVCVCVSVCHQDNSKSSTNFDEIFGGWDVWLGGRVVREPDLRSTGRGFESRPPRCQVQPWASCLHTHVSVTKQYNLIPANGRWCSAPGEVTAGQAERNGSLYGWVYGFGHLRADCRGPGSAPELYAHFEYDTTFGMCEIMSTLLRGLWAAWREVCISTSVLLIYYYHCYDYKKHLL